jgi:hypothetical protein
MTLETDRNNNIRRRKGEWEGGGKGRRRERRREGKGEWKLTLLCPKYILFCDISNIHLKDRKLWVVW